jgi:LmbE family N-acetylglucosaminyl deacetylase
VTQVLVITAHPDDVDFGAAGTVAAFTEAGVVVTYCIVTSGEAGGSDRSMSRSDMAALRQAEQRAAAAEVGVTDIDFLGYPDGRVTASLELRRDISRVIRQRRPQRVLTANPVRLLDRMYASHPDHLATGEAAIDAVYPDARNPFAHPELLADEGLEPHTVAELWIMTAVDSNVVVETTSVFDRKIRALLSHRSQIAEGSDMPERLRQGASAVAAESGLPPGSLAEAFLRFPTL